MYLEYFGFEEEPFNITPNSRFLFLSERHRDALASLLYGIEHRKGFIALTGAIGCGKTTICRAMLGRLDREKVRLALILNPELNDLELLQTINAEYGIPATSSSKRELLAQLNKFLLAEYEADRNVVLLIDEAQRLSPLALEQVRLLSNLETESAKLIQIALVGQPELAEILDLPELEQLNQRITVRYHISPLDADQIGEYIDHRLEVAKPTRPVTFSKRAVKRIFEYSGGVPRRVNVVSDRALLVAFVQETSEVTEQIIEKAIEEVGGMPKRPRAEQTEQEVVAANDYAASLKRNRKARRAPAKDVTEDSPNSVLVPVLSLVIASLVAFVVYTQRAEIEAFISGTTAQVAVTATPLAPAPAPLAPVVAAATQSSPSPMPDVQVAPAASDWLFPAPTPALAEQIIAAATATPAPTPPPVMAPRPVMAVEPEMRLSWEYDGDGILRVERREQTYPAAMLTWLHHQRGSRLAADDLAALRTMTNEQLRALRLTAGAPPFYLREALLPPSLSVIRPADLPAILSTDEDSPDFGPWVVLVSLDESTVTLHDPLRGKIVRDREIFEDHLARITVPFSDPHALVGLTPDSQGDAVSLLQKHLRVSGHYERDPSGVFDDATLDALNSFRQTLNLPAGEEVDALLAMRLLRSTEGEVAP